MIPSAHVRFPYRFASVLALVLASAAPTFAGDLKAAEMLVSRARSSLDSNRFEETENRLTEAEKELEGLATDASAALKKRIDEIRAESRVSERRFHADPLTRALERHLEAATREFEEGTRGDGNAEVASEMERPLSLLLEQVDSDDVKKWLTEEVREGFKSRAADLRLKGEQAGYAVHVRRAESWIGKVESVNAGTNEEQVYRDGVRRWMDLAVAEIGALPDTDPRVSQLSKRLDAARRGFDDMTAADDRNAGIDEVIERWKWIRGDEADTAKAKSEVAPSYELWLVQGSLEMPMTETCAHRARQMLEDESFLQAKRDNGSDPRVVALAGEVEAAAAAAGATICDAASKLLDRAERDEATRPRELVTALTRLRDVIERSGRDAATYEETKARAERRIAALEASEAKKASALAEMEKKCAAAADASWPSIVESCGESGAIDPVECVENVDDWKDRLIRVQGTRNRARWDFSAGDYDFIVSVNGVPVAGQIAPELREAISKVESATGLSFDSSLIDDVVGVVVGACRVQGIEYSQLLQEHIPTVNYKAPLLRIVALRAGPFALSAERSCSDEVESVASASTGGDSGVPWFKSLVIVALIVFGVKRRNEIVTWLRPRMTTALEMASRRMARAQGR